MGKSRKKPIIKDKCVDKELFHRKIRKRQNQFINQYLTDEGMPNSKSIVSDYDYCDYRFDERWNKNNEKWTRK